ncbi:hypothetical protein JSE7799_00750 [Jannaschia seosinensis]|uniref:Hedgehog/Intein (Hint) domain-containing protein n=1 Tax=Jannaschia seosinensis TaxID=313367 RepID=A0A0M7B9Q1_9RHOB|nr:Hint domain-containing protein [Jannaschia seosinensis]CUH26763.1 hypothetical protein JSE7799_00750 [Jannaschia seosinensis]
MGHEPRMSQPPLFSKPGFPETDLTAPPRREPPARFPSGTLLATPNGPRPVEGIIVGDAVVTADGPRRVAQVSRRVTARADWAFARRIWPVRVPVGSLGNPRPLRLAPDQRVILSGDAVQRSSGEAELSVPVGALIGLRGLIIERPLAALRCFGFGFGRPARIEAESVICVLDKDEPFDAEARERARAAFLAMQVAGEPRLRVR